MISKEEVARIAHLAKLRLGPEELERMTRDLGRILEFVEQIGVVVNAAPADERDSTPLRADEIVPSLDHDRVSANAPSFANGHFLVPRVLGGGE